MKHIALTSIFIISVLFSYAQIYEGGGEYLFSKQSAMCVSNKLRAKIILELRENINELKKQGSLKNSKTIPQFIWPVQQASGFNYESIWLIIRYVDHDPSYPNMLLDYNCGNKTYDLSTGYNHRGTDISLWPFSWNQFYLEQAEVVAAATGKIVLKHDGNYDMNCSFGGSSWNAVYVQHGDGSVAWYGHMKKGSLTPKVVGDSVFAGEFLGKIGSSGNSAGPHLHFEVHDNSSNLIDPFAGSCNSLNSNSWWANQLPYVNTNINALMSHHAPPKHDTCPMPAIINDANYFNSSDSVFLACYLRNELNGTTLYCTLYDPTGSVYASWTKTFATDHTASYWYWCFTNLPLNGHWTFEANYQSQTLSHGFDVGVSTITESRANNNLNIYPNPTNDVVIIDNGDFNLMTNYTLKIINTLGQEVFNSLVTIPLFQIPISTFGAEGLYYVQIYDGNNALLERRKLVLN